MPSVPPRPPHPRAPCRMRRSLKSRPSVSLTVMVLSRRSKRQASPLAGRPTDHASHRTAEAPGARSRSMLWTNRAPGDGMTWSGMYSSRAPSPTRTVTRCREGDPALRYTRGALGVERQTWLPAPRSTRVSRRSPPSTPPVGFSRKSVRAPVPSRSMGSRAWRGSVKRRPVRTVRPWRRSKARPRKPSRPVRPGDGASGLEEELVPDPVHHELGAGPVPEIGEDKGPVSSHALGVPLHHAEVGADIGREVDFVDHEKVGACDAGAALARDLLPFCHVDDVDGRVHELGAEGRREVVTAALDEQHLERRESAHELVHGFQIDGGVLAYRRMGAAARLDPQHPVLGQGAAPDEELRVLLRVDVIGDHGQIVDVAQPNAERLDERRLSRAHGTAHPDAKRPRNAGGATHERKSLMSSPACRMPASSMPGAKLQISFTSRAAASRATRSMTGCRLQSTRCPSSWPMERSRSAAPTRSAVDE